MREPIIVKERVKNTCSSLRSGRRPLRWAGAVTGHTHALVALAGAVAALLGAAPASAVSGPWAKRITGYLRASNGTLLHYSVLLPSSHGRFPVVMNYSGYDAGSIGGVAYREGQTAMWPRLDASLLRAGYAVFGVNMPGTGCSGGGAFDLFSRRWGIDGRDAVEWAARQKWSTGKIGMDNWSFAGLSQLFTAVERPPHLRAIAPGMVVTDPLRDVSSLGGVPNTLFPAGWWLFILSEWSNAKATGRAEHDNRCLSNIADPHRQEQEHSPPAEQALHPFYDAFIAKRELWMRTDLIDVPVLSLEDWQDEATGVRGGYYSRARSIRTARGTSEPTASMTCLYEPPVAQPAAPVLRSVPQGSAQWIREAGSRPDLGGHHCSGRTTPERPAARAGQAGVGDQAATTAGRGQADENSGCTPGGSQTSNRSAAGEQPSSYLYPDASPTVNADLSGGEHDWMTKVPSATDSLSFTTAPLRHAVTFFGPASADLWISSTATDTDLQVTVTEVRPDGREEYVQRGWLRVSQRALDKRLSTELRPFHLQTAASVAPLAPGVPVLARVEIQKFSHAFRAGSTIRIWIDTPSTTGEEGFAALETRRPTASGPTRAIRPASSSDAFRVRRSRRPSRSAAR